jgi:hypothetical protein
MSKSTAAEPEVPPLRHPPSARRHGGPFAASFPRRTLCRIPSGSSGALQQVLSGVLAICVEAERDTSAGRVPNHVASVAVGCDLFNACNMVFWVYIKFADFRLFVFTGFEHGVWPRA